MATLVQAVAVGWRVYEISGAPMALGLIGLAQFAPMFLLALPCGELCDRRNPRVVLGLGLLLAAVCSGALFAVSRAALSGVWPFYLVMVLFGVARALCDSPGQALLPFLVAPDRLPTAIAWNSSLWQTAVIAGPALGGFLYAFGPASVFLTCCVAFLCAAIGAVSLGGRRAEPQQVRRNRIDRIGEGFRFVWSRPVILGAVSLDLVAVLLGGATALLPAYARDVLHAGSIGLGLLRSAPAVGACAAGLYQTRRERRASLFAAVAVFGAATVVFGVSKWLSVSLVALCVMGAADMVSVNVRSALIQLETPDAMRGRVSAVSMLFVSASAELGEFESGLAAAVMGVAPAVVLGGLGALVAIPVWMRVFPGLARFGKNI